VSGGKAATHQVRSAHGGEKSAIVICVSGATAIKAITEETLERAFEELEREQERKPQQFVAGEWGHGKTMLFLDFVRRYALPLEDIGEERTTPVLMIIDDAEGTSALELWATLARGVRSREQFDSLVELLTPHQQVPSQAVLEQARRNADARSRFLDEFPAVASGDVADLVGSRSRNRAALAHTWRKQGRIFAVAVGREQRYPLFQFDPEAGEPKSQLQQVLRALRTAGLKGWQLALWFAGPLAELDDRRPVDLLDKEPELVLEAAEAVEDIPW
jgi:hypothetical protein